MRNAGRLLTLILPWLLPLAAHGQPRSPEGEVGLPFFIEHFTPMDYGAHPQNWWITQDRRGVIYVANEYGILEYDGETWRLIYTPTNVRSLAVDEKGVVYAGVEGDLGYLEPDSSGTLHFVSLLDRIDPRERDVHDVWATHITRNGTYFQTNEKLFRWNGSEMQVWKPREVENWFHTSYTVRGRFYIREQEVGLLEMDGDSLHLVRGGERFSQTKIYVMVPYDEDRILIGTREEGFFLYDGISISRFATQADDFVSAYRLYHGAALPGGYFALATLDGGVAVINRQGRLVQVIDQSNGSPDGTVNYVYPDAQGGLWMALHNSGILRVDTPSPLTLYDRRLGLEGMPLDITRHQGRLYVATTAGLHYLDQKPLIAGEPRSYFKQVAGISEAWDLSSSGDVLFAATADGLYQIRGSKLERLGKRVTTFALYESRRFENRLYLGRQDGLAFIERTPSGWTEPRTVTDKLSEKIRSIVEQADGTLWLSTKAGRVIRLRFGRQPGAEPVLGYFDEANGLPEGEVILTSLSGHLVFPTSDGVYRRVESDAGRNGKRGWSFERIDSLGAASEEASLGKLLVLHETDKGDIWMAFEDRIDHATRRPDGKLHWETPALFRSIPASVSRILHEDNGVVWLSRDAMLLRYDPGLQEVYDLKRSRASEYHVLIRRISSAGSGNVIFGGAFADVKGGMLAEQTDLHVPTFDYAQNDLHIEFAAPSFSAGLKNEYQFYLEGHDNAWSEWTRQTQKTYTHLVEGDYTFRVRARNAQGIMSREAHFSFQVLPPWYRTWWAYLLYFGILIVGTFTTGHYRRIIRENKLAQQQALELSRERVVNERLQQANRRLEMANESLTQADRLKDELLANTSHELRTPITAILGFTSVLKEELPGEHREFISIIEASGHRLLHTVNLMLDFARLRAGMMELRCERIAVVEHVEQVIQQLTPIALAKNLPIELVEPEEALFAWVDRLCLERILYNLISNAIKFTDQGSVRISLAGKDDHVYVRVVDTGVGMEETFLPYLFDPFKQESTGLARSYEGSGLGLAVTAQLVSLMDGKIAVESKKGEGSTFEVGFPWIRGEEQAATASEAAIRAA